MLSFLTQLDVSLKADATRGCESSFSRSKPKIELRFANRTKHTQGGYGSVLSWEFFANLRYSTAAVRTLRFPQRLRYASSRPFGISQPHRHTLMVDPASKDKCSGSWIPFTKQ